VAIHLVTSKRIGLPERPLVSQLNTEHALANGLSYAMLDPITQIDHVRNAAPTTRYMFDRRGDPTGSMARFNGTSSSMVTAFTGSSTLRTWAFWMLRAGAGGSGFGRMLVCNVTSTANEGFSWNGTVSEFGYSRAFNTSQGSWTVPYTVSNTRLVVVSFDGSSVANDPLFNINGAPVTPTERTTPSGTLVTLTTPFQIGGLSGSVVGWDGWIGPLLCWDRILTDAEKWSLYDPATRWDLWQQPSARLWFDLAAPGGGNRRRRFLIGAAA
jgi:hypothetical protein